jgi:hypothetical protein
MQNSINGKHYEKADDSVHYIFFAFFQITAVSGFQNHFNYAVKQKNDGHGKSEYDKRVYYKSRYLIQETFYHTGILSGKQKLRKCISSAILALNTEFNY